MNFKWCMLFLVIVCVQVTLSLASQKRKKNEEETKENSINYYYNELLHRPGHLLTSMLHDATLPVFLVMGVASVASVLTNVSWLSQSPLTFLTLFLSLLITRERTKDRMVFMEGVRGHLHLKAGHKTFSRSSVMFKRQLRSISIWRMKLLMTWMNQSKGNLRVNRVTNLPSLTIWDW